MRFAARERLTGLCPGPASEDPEEVKNGMWEHIKENKILAIGFVVCMILASYVSQKKAVEKDLNFLNGKLNNQGFLSKAPAQQIENERAKLAKAQEKMAKIEESIAALKKL